ncbi:MAG: transglutaminase-like domain-containing protein [Nanoarchaeota archaeon]
MNKLTLLILFLLLIPSIFADSWNYDSEEVTVNFALDSEIDILRDTANSKVSYIKVNLSFFPKDTLQQKVITLTTSPGSEKDSETIQFTWENPTVDNLKFRLDSKIRILNDNIKVTRKVAFPIKVPENLKVYTKPSTTIDSDDPDIFILANELATGQDDLYKVVFNLGTWVKSNVEYDLSSLTANVAQKSSWVLKTRQGVCDELTNLFIALNRVLGIPARFVSGIAYTNSKKFSQEWGPHGWAEVYFPGFGWVPFDVTYGQLGYIDPTHIKLKESLDADDASTKYQWSGHGIEIETNVLDFDVGLIDHSGSLPAKISLDLNSVKSAVMFGSYNLIEATVKNLKNYYVANELYLSKPSEVEIIDNERKQLILGPYEEKKVYWTVKISDLLQKNFIYTFPLTVYSLENITDSAYFTSSRSDFLYNLKEIESILSLKDQKEEKELSKNVDLDCSINKPSLYEYETAIIACAIKNTGTTLLSGVNICLKNDCEKMALGIGEEKQSEFNFAPEKAGEQELLIEVKNADVLQNQFLKVNVKDTPSITLSELEYPEFVSFKEEYIVSFILNKNSVSIAKNIIVELKESGFTKTWTLSELTNNKKFIINLKGKDLGTGKNTMEILVKYYDSNDNEYETSDSFSIQLNKISFIERLQIYVTDFAKFLNRFF